jgi:hypothetical protein
MRKRVADHKVVRRRTRAGRTAVVGALALAGVLALGFALTESQALAQGPKHFKATRRIVVDLQSGQVRMPTTEEVQKLVTDLASLTKRAAEGLPEGPAPGGGVGINLDGGFGGVMLARPNDDGTFETLCVFTFDEGAAFLGLVEDIA